MHVRPPAVAGMFYPGDPRTLTATVDHLLKASRSPLSEPPKALIVPHAGYIYSGSTAAAAYAPLAQWAATIKRVVLLGQRTGSASRASPCRKPTPSRPHSAR